MQPRTVSPIVVVLAFAAGCAGTGDSVARSEHQATDPTRPVYCVQYWAEARYRNYGYDHVVHLLNACSSRAACEVWTDVNPKREHVVVPAGQRAKVVTFRGSPASEFVAYASCELVP